MKVYIGCFGSGLGHASRMMEIARELKTRGAEVEFSSSGEVASIISSKGYRCNRVPLADVHYSVSGVFQVMETVLDFPTILAQTYRQLAYELANIGSFSPDVVLSDSAMPTVIAGKIHRLPVFTVLNQLNLTSSHRRRGAPSRVLSVGTSAIMGRLWELSDEILLPDLPPPFTISEKNLWGSRIEKTRYVGFLLPTEAVIPDEAAKEFAVDIRPKVYWQVSGPPRTRTPFLRMAMEFAQQLKDRYAFTISGGDPGGKTSPHRIGRGWYYEWCDIADFYFQNCDVVVARAGHGTVGQAIVSMKPSLLIPIPKQPEQEGNAEKASKLGVAKVVSQGDMSLKVLQESVDSLMDGGYRDRVSKLGHIARGYNGRTAIVATIEAAAMRGRQ